MRETAEIIACEDGFKEQPQRTWHSILANHKEVADWSRRIDRFVATFLSPSSAEPTQTRMASYKAGEVPDRVKSYLDTALPQLAKAMEKAGIDASTCRNLVRAKRQSALIALGLPVIEKSEAKAKARASLLEPQRVNFESAFGDALLAQWRALLAEHEAVKNVADRMDTYGRKLNVRVVKFGPHPHHRQTFREHMTPMEEELREALGEAGIEESLEPLVQAKTTSLIQAIFPPGEAQPTQKYVRKPGFRNRG